ncbi:MAG: enoyl-CoA hydratase-related protein [Dehalococcoidia bacterium]
MADDLLYEKRGRVALLTMNRPHRMNALSTGLLEALHEGWTRFAGDDDAWVAVLTGAGDRAFCAGADLKDMDQRQQSSDDGPPARRFKYRGFTPRELHIYKPTIAAVNGYALAGGWWMAQDCDLVVASEEAQFGITETLWNLPGPWAADLTTRISIRHAIEATVVPERISAHRAWQMGFVNWVVPKDQVLPKALEIAEAIAERCAPGATRAFIETYYRCFGMPTDQARATAGHIQRHLMTMEDAKEGPRAFVERRKPAFKNR